MIEHIQTLSEECHQDAVSAGWWNDLSTGEPIRRNVGELLMLCVTEVTEAREGLLYGYYDNHLPDHTMFSVELADICIRLFDMIGHLGLQDQVQDFALARTGAGLRSEDAELILFDVIDALSKAMEHWRKSRTTEMAAALARALCLIEGLAELEGVPLLDVIDEKRAYNAQRDDHKPENRLKDGGKKV